MAEVGGGGLSQEQVDARIAAATAGMPTSAAMTAALANKADTSAIPQPASSTPPGVADTGCGIAQTTSGATDLFNVQIDGAPTNTQVTFRITRYVQSFLSLLGLNVLTFNGTPGSITLHMTALEP